MDALGLKRWEQPTQWSQMGSFDSRWNYQNSGGRGTPLWTIAIEPRSLIMMRDGADRGVNGRRLGEIWRGISGDHDSREQRRKDNPDQDCLAPIAPRMPAKRHVPHRL